MAKQSILFSATFVGLFMLSFLFLARMDMLPEPVDPASALSPQGPAFTPSAQDAEEPVRIVAQTIGLDKTVITPDSTDVDVLDSALLKGAVHYPGSALLGGQGTVLIFGHSSYLPIVHNQNYKAFDGIQNLKPGDIVSVYSAGAEYRYTVESVATAAADQDKILRINLPQDGAHLMLVTCDSFGSKTSRFVVTAQFQGAYRI